MRVWTRQHIKVLEKINKDGIYIATTDIISLDMPEHKEIMVDVYTWLAENMPSKNIKPKYAVLPIWVALQNETAYLPVKDTNLIELEVDEKLLCYVNTSKWGTILNYSYIAKNTEDYEAHIKLLKKYGTSDTVAYMSNFYPQIKDEIRKSWLRLFDDTILINGDTNKYGLLWEIKKEWIVNVNE